MTSARRLVLCSMDQPIVEFHPEAQTEYLEALSWYRERSLLADLRFEAEFIRLSKKSGRHPTAGRGTSKTLGVSCSTNFRLRLSIKILPILFSSSLLHTAIDSPATGKIGSSSAAVRMLRFDHNNSSRGRVSPCRCSSRASSARRRNFPGSAASFSFQAVSSSSVSMI